jgi:small-conductance mechanosensitive channel
MLLPGTCVRSSSGLSGTVRSVFTSAIPCWEQDASLCAWLYEVTGGNEAISKSADWLLVRPLQILLILFVAWILVRLSRRWVTRSISRIIAPDREGTARRLKAIGVTAPAALVTELHDPRRDTRARVISTVVSGTISVLIWTIALIMAAGRANLELGPLIAGAGIAGIALGFGAQSLVKDLIAGLFLLLEDQYGIGDVVDVGEASGVVERFSLRATVLRGVDGTAWHVPNGEITRVGNRSQLWSVALVDVDVAYDTDLVLVREVLHRAAADVCEHEPFIDSVIDSPEILGVEALGADGITLRLIVKTAPGTQWGLQRALREAIKQAFDLAGVEIPFPQRTVWMRVSSDDNGATGSGDM